MSLLSLSLALPPPPPPPPPPLLSHLLPIKSVSKIPLSPSSSSVYRQMSYVNGSKLASSSSTAASASAGFSLRSVAPLEAILFDIDGTLCDSDPLHFYAFREMLQQIGFNGGTPISEKFFIENISGRDNEALCGILFPDWELHSARQFLIDKEAMYQRLASQQLQPAKGLLLDLCKWVEKLGLKRAAVTNAPRSNAELMILIVGLSDFFDVLVIGTECDRPKPFPDPYLTALRSLVSSHQHAFVFEDSVSGTKAAVAAGMPVVGLGERNPEILLTEAGAVLVIEDFDDPKLWMALEELESLR